MGPAFALLMAAKHIDLHEAVRLAMAALPKASWSSPSTVSGGTLLTASHTSKLEDAIWAQTEGPAQIVVGFKEPPIVENDQLYLLKEGAAKPQRFPWKSLPHSYAIFHSDLGRGAGFRWFSRGSFHFAEKVRRAPKLQGGDDPLAMAVTALRTKDRAHLTSNFGYDTLRKAKDKAVPYVRTEIDRNDLRTRATAIGLLGEIRTASAGYELLKLYKTGNKHDRAAVKGAAAYRPSLPMLRPVYRDLLREGKWVIAPAEAAAQHRWTEFLPRLKRAMHRTTSPLEALALYDAIDTLGPQNLPESTTRAARLFRIQGFQPSLLDVFRTCPDPKYKCFFALHLYGYRSKGSAPHREEALALLESVPAAVKASLGKRFRIPQG